MNLENYYLIERSIYCNDALEFEKSKGKIIKMKSDRWAKLYKRGKFPYKVIF